MTSKQQTLLDLPISIANQVLEKLGPVEILTCRKVCRSLRTAIDKLGTHFNKISIRLWDNSVSVDFDGIGINYCNEFNGGSCVWFKKQQKTIEGVNYIKAAFIDLKILLRHTSQLYISSREKYRHNTVSYFVDVLKEDVNIHVETVTLNKFSFDDVLLILPLFNSQTLEEILLWETVAADEFEQITHLDQWKNTKKFNFWICSFECEHIEYLFHFEEFSIYTDEFPIQSAIKVRDDLLTRSTFQECTIFIVKANLKPVELAQIFQADYSDGDAFKINYSNYNSNFAIHCEDYSFVDDKWKFVIQRT
ncbi:F-box domain-containing protein [Caenorhabditis elegans]|uniref:F-box domain-containing protein n=1 Tax=Caenorhabditis elegans TaxID=6239 RepID=A4F329_CAEEL|nr:F-box domain-containing protein [Caenorhabditis elegans]CCD73937.1 F-box domain-containing protein [Caenorhabditis elegans]|eukprot:NP_497363.1 F-box A protein [Caenorhabditis elegans]